MTATITERTPNPRTLRVLPGVPVSDMPSEFFSRDARDHPFLADVFSIPGVESVLLGTDFVSVTSDDPAAWDHAAKVAEAAAAVAKHAGAYPRAVPRARMVDAGGRASHIEAILDSRIRPVVAHDGGDVEMVSFSDGVLRLRMRGACSGCPSAPATLKHGIMGVMRQFAPDVAEVRPA